MIRDYFAFVMEDSGMWLCPVSAPPPLTILVCFIHSYSLTYIFFPRSESLSPLSPLLRSCCCSGSRAFRPAAAIRFDLLPFLWSVHMQASHIECRARAAAQESETAQRSTLYLHSKPFEVSSMGDGLPKIDCTAIFFIYLFFFSNDQRLACIWAEIYLCVCACEIHFRSKNLKLSTSHEVWTCTLVFFGG